MSCFCLFLLKYRYCNYSVYNSANALPDTQNKRFWDSRNSNFFGEQAAGLPYYARYSAAGTHPLVLLRIWLLDIGEPPRVTSLESNATIFFFFFFLQTCLFLFENGRCDDSIYNNAKLKFPQFPKIMLLNF